MPDSDIEKLADHYEEVAELFSPTVSHPENDAHKFVSKLDEIRGVIEDTGHPHLNFQLFFINKFERDLWNNIAMSSSQNLDDEFIASILRSVGSQFEYIGKHTREENFKECYSAYVELWNDYLRMIEIEAERRKKQ